MGCQVFSGNYVAMAFLFSQLWNIESEIENRFPRSSLSLALTLISILFVRLEKTGLTGSRNGWRSNLVLRVGFTGLISSNHDG